MANKKILSYYTVIFLSGIFAGLLNACLDLPYIVFTAYIPLMCGLMFSSSRRNFITSFLYFFIPYFGIQFSFLLTIYKLINIYRPIALLLSFMAFVLLILWECLLMLIPVYTFLWIRRNDWLDVISLSLLICTGEWLSENIFFLAFSWSGAWVGVSESAILSQPANLLGCQFVSFLILALSGYTGRLIFKKSRLISLTFSSIIVLFAFIYGNFSIKHTENKIRNSNSEIYAYAIQSSSEGNEKRHTSAKTFAEFFTSEINQNTFKPNSLILLPESSIPENFNKDNNEFSKLSKSAKAKHCTVITGCFCKKSNKRYNALYAINSEGIYSKPYFKQVLVPFGEKVPFAFLFGKSTLSSCDDKEFSMPVNVSDHKIGTAICIESIFPEKVRTQSKNGAEILCISTNDSWFGKSFARRQHYRHSIMRAVENGKYLIRSGNCGISAIISPTGKQLKVKSDKSAGIINSKAVFIKENTICTKTGSLFSAIMASVITIALIKRFTKK